MASLKTFLIVNVLAVLALATVSYATAIKPRMSNGAEVDTLRRFPHHVTIEPIYRWYNNGGPQICGGSIIQQNWILTSSRCVRDSSRLILQMERLHKDDTSGSYSIVVNNDPSNVILYPTEFDDVALVKVPVDFIFSNTIKPISILRSSFNQLKNKLAVLPGFDKSTVSSYSSTPYYSTRDPSLSSSSPYYSTTVPTSYSPSRTDNLTYAMLSIVPNSVCQSAYKPIQVFDEFLNICTKGWGNNRNTPCLTDFGSGLVVNWPADPQLVGIYSSSSYDCDSSSPSVYVNVQKYSSWIDSVILNN